MQQSIHQAAQTLTRFVGRRQLHAMIELYESEDGQFFKDKLVEWAGVINTMPKTHEQEDKGGEAIAHLHYFMGGFDWYILEKDMETEQLQAFGYANMGFPELGYISIEEITQYGAELDLHWKPTKLADIEKKHQR